MSKTIAVIRGDGIGPEIMDATLRVLDALDVGLEYEFVEAGVGALEKHGELLPQATLDAIAQHRIALKGPLTTPVGGGFSSINVELRKRFDLYANVRPAISFPNTKSRFPEDIDLITVRENTEGAYIGEGQTLVRGRRDRDADAEGHAPRLRAHRALRVRSGAQHRSQESHDRAQGEHPEVDLGPVPEGRARSRRAISGDRAATR